jgi:regulator of protease activity HflC (stomatin/prohibitin superfamily)
MIAEKTYRPMNGWFPLFVTLVMIVAGIWFVISKAIALGNYGGRQDLVFMISGIVILLLGVLSIFGFMAIQPNQARVLLLFGKYKGSALKSGFYWVNPFFSKKKISLRIRNFETGSIHHPEQKSAQGQVIQAKSRTSGKPSKVNDRDGNPIEISAVVVWRVVNTAEALFEVDDFEDFVAVQSEAALRNMASRHPYDSADNEISLRGSTDEICAQLEADIQERLDKAGVDVIEARISHLAYSPEIAAAMLQRQQAQAVVAARTKIVEGAVGMVEMALDDLSKKNIIDLDDERRAAMVSNLLVVLCSDRHTQPVVNTGTLYT